MTKSFKEMLYFLILLTVFIFVYALLGMELYANQIKFDPVTDEPIPCDESNLFICAALGDSPRVNFDNL
jgi:Ion transport protein